MRKSSITQETPVWTIADAAVPCLPLLEGSAITKCPMHNNRIAMKKVFQDRDRGRITGTLDGSAEAVLMSNDRLERGSVIARPTNERTDSRIRGALHRCT